MRKIQLWLNLIRIFFFYFFILVEFFSLSRYCYCLLMRTHRLLISLAGNEHGKRYLCSTVICNNLDIYVNNLLVMILKKPDEFTLIAPATTVTGISFLRYIHFLLFVYVLKWQRSQGKIEMWCISRHNNSVASYSILFEHFFANTFWIETPTIGNSYIVTTVVDLFFSGINIIDAFFFLLQLYHIYLLQYEYFCMFCSISSSNRMKEGQFFFALICFVR